MEGIISEEEQKTLQPIKGEVRGLSIKGHAKFLLETEGTEAPEKVEKVMQSLGYDFHYERIQKMGFYPLNLYCTELLVIQRLFSYNNEKFKEIGEFNSKNSLLVRLFMKYFVSLGTMANQAAVFWRKYFTEGDISIPDYNEKEKFVILRLKNLTATSLFCEVTRGFFSAMCQMITGEKGSCEETKCELEGEDCHEFLFKW